MLSNIQTNVVLPQNQMTFKAKGKDLKEGLKTLDEMAFLLPYRTRGLTEEGRKRVKKIVDKNMKQAQKTYVALSLLSSLEEIKTLLLTKAKGFCEPILKNLPKSKSL